MTAMLPALVTAPDVLLDTVRSSGYAVLSPQAWTSLFHLHAAELEALPASWNDLPLDRYLRDGGRYRRRRHASYVVRDGGVESAPHRAHWQPLAYNALHGGLERWFEPIARNVAAAPVWQRLLTGFAGVCSALAGAQPWFVEAHQFRIDTTDGIGRPTPEGAHRDGVDYVAVLLVKRMGIKGAETRVFEAEGPAGVRFTMEEPWSVLFLDDQRVVHESTPIQPLESYGYRDTLVLTFRSRGFQGPDAGGGG